MRTTYTLIAILLLSAFSIFAQKGGVSGVVVSRVGRTPVAEAVVSINYGLQNRVTVSADGAFAITGITKGEYFVSVQAQGYIPLEIGVKIDSTTVNLRQVSLSPEFPLDIDDNIQTEYDGSEVYGSQDLSSGIFYSKDLFDNVAAYKFGALRFRSRGYGSDMTDVYMNGIRMNDALNGQVPWMLWSGLNEATRNQECTGGVAATDYGVGGFGGSTNVNIRASRMKKGFSGGGVNSGAQYRYRVMATYASGENDKGWSYALSASARYGGNYWVNAAYYSGLSYFGSLEKRLDDHHRIALTAFGAPSVRSMQVAATQETYDLVSSNYYNSGWGFQGDLKRNSRIRDTHEPVVMLNYDFTPDINTTLSISAYYRFGRSGYSGLDWYDVPDPRPDYYRNLPSYYPDDTFKAETLREAWLNDWNTRQINWAKIYEINTHSPEDYLIGGKGGINKPYLRSRYIIEDRRRDQKDINAVIRLTRIIRKHDKLIAGVNIRVNDTENYKRAKDLLGGEAWLDIDKFAEGKGGGEEDIQNDLKYPNRLVGIGDKFGYDYMARLREVEVWSEYFYKNARIDAYLAVEAGRTSFWRDGIFRKGLFPNNSEGESVRQDFLTYSAKAGFTYKFSGRNTVSLNLASSSHAPHFENAFVSPRTRNTVAPGLSSEQVVGGDINYILRLKKLRMRLSGYYTSIVGQTKLYSFYDDLNGEFVNFNMHGVAQSHLGAELGMEVPIISTLSAKVVVSIGEYKYKLDPVMQVVSDNSDRVIRDGEHVYWKDSKVGGTPQTAINLGLNYVVGKIWFLGFDANYFARNYVDMSPLRRTDYANQGLNAEQSSAMVAQEMFPEAIVLNLNIGRLYYLEFGKFIGFNLEVRNLLNKQNIKTGGYEQSRLRTQSDGSYTPFDDKYYYMFGTTYLLNLYYRF